MADTAIAEPNESEAAAVARLGLSTATKVDPNPNPPPLDGALYEITRRRLYRRHGLIVGSDVSRELVRLRWRKPLRLQNVLSAGTSPPALEVYGDPHRSLAVNLALGVHPKMIGGTRTVVLDIVTAGALGVAAFRYSIDGGAQWHADPAAGETPVTVEAQVILHGCDLRFAAGTFSADNEYRFDVVTESRDLSATPTTFPVGP